MSRPLSTSLKRQVCRTTLAVFGHAFELCSERVPAFAAEIAEWEEGRRLEIGIAPLGPTMTIEKRDGRIRYLGLTRQNPRLSILFKNLDSALLVFTGQIGAPLALAENRIVIHGENVLAMQATRAMAIVQTYLFPGFILRKTFKRPPRLGISELKTKAAIYALLAPRLLRGPCH